ncbi:AMP-binding protein [Pseudonocardia parietis]|uniref:Fatty-acyl-CoA synthase n=1 Tax=Pseudonocardia parietis TaxID=570936 RepID=A0ABS4W354_9PSEU|nr:AMP-binding protein [Pseudonocardia parietis]MBP2370619.1 fatty-acyl-CoA synthase [Pseudonocardia parietis]
MVAATTGVHGGSSSAGHARSDVEEILDALGTHRDREVLVHADRRWTAGEVADTVHRLAHTLDGRVRPGTIVALLAGNTPEVLMARWAVNLLGAGATQPHDGLSAAAQARIVDDVDADLVLTQSPHAVDVLERARPVEARALVPDLLAAAADAPATPIHGRTHAGDVATIRHTGGTTGHPKGITYTFGHHARAATIHRTLSRLAAESARLLVATPIAHAGGGLADRILAGGGTVVLQDRFDAGDFLAAVERERITHTWLLPPLMYRLLDHPALDRTDLSSLRTVIYGGAPANARRMAEAHRRIGPVFTQFYGQTEAGGISVLTPAEHDRPDLLATVGRVVPSTEIAIIDAGGSPAGTGECGELWVRTGTEMDGYWKQPELTAGTIVDGWVRTGDVARLDASGYLHLVDRVKDMVVVVGGHVYTAELEDTLMEHPGVRQAAVFGAPDGDGTEAVHATVVPGSPAPSADDLAGLVAQRAGDMYVPRAIRFVEELPLTGIGKTDKKRLRAELTG